MSESVSSKDALFMLDTSMEEEMASYGDEATGLVIKHINSNPSVYDYVKGNLEYGLSIEDSVKTWTKNHNNEFGELFETELDVVDWKKVKERV